MKGFAKVTHVHSIAPPWGDIKKENKREMALIRTGFCKFMQEEENSSGVAVTAAQHIAKLRTWADDADPGVDVEKCESDLYFMDVCLKKATKLYDPGPGFTAQMTQIDSVQLILPGILRRPAMKVEDDYYQRVAEKNLTVGNKLNFSTTEELDLWFEQYSLEHALTRVLTYSSSLFRGVAGLEVYCERMANARAEKEINEVYSEAVIAATKNLVSIKECAWSACLGTFQNATVYLDENVKNMPWHANYKELMRRGAKEALSQFLFQLSQKYHGKDKIVKALEKTAMVVGQETSRNPVNRR
ncbi:hypothetical protein HPB49_020043 [Dermacentor silvarum]|uniref:Uncharacterized protein n=1 Tax=Dermacentor silvarum TaxID=543639 RepID=A0ACB8CMC5_DERSI|nr:hypothetical protein HPB49_020043 [Dermacentor silvarum]